MLRKIGTHEAIMHDVTEEEQKQLENVMYYDVLSTLGKQNTGTVLSWVRHPINPVHPCCFRRNPLGGGGDPNTEVCFDCQVIDCRMAAKIPLIFISRHSSPDYIKQLRIVKLTTAIFTMLAQSKKKLTLTTKQLTGKMSQSVVHII